MGTCYRGVVSANGSSRGLAGEVQQVAHGSQSSQIGILLLIVMLRVDPTAFVQRCAVRTSSGREERISRDEGQTRRCRARSRVAAIIRSGRRVYAIGRTVDLASESQLSHLWRSRRWLSSEQRRARLSSWHSTTGSRYCSSGRAKLWRCILMMILIVWYRYLSALR